jgi:hypothetical protein
VIGYKTHRGMCIFVSFKVLNIISSKLIDLSDDVDGVFLIVEVLPRRPTFFFALKLL